MGFGPRYGLWISDREPAPNIFDIIRIIPRARHIIEPDIIRFGFKGARIAGCAKGEDIIAHRLSNMAHGIMGQLMSEDIGNLFIFSGKIHHARGHHNAAPIGISIDCRGLF